MWKRGYWLNLLTLFEFIPSKSQKVDSLHGCHHKLHDWNSMHTGIKDFNLYPDRFCLNLVHWVDSDKLRVNKRMLEGPLPSSLSFNPVFHLFFSPLLNQRQKPEYHVVCFCTHPEFQRIHLLFSFRLLYISCQSFIPNNNDDLNTY